MPAFFAQLAKSAHVFAKKAGNPGGSPFALMLRVQVHQLLGIQKAVGAAALSGYGLIALRTCGTWRLVFAKHPKAEELSARRRRGPDESQFRRGGDQYFLEGHSKPACIRSFFTFPVGGHRQAFYQGPHLRYLVNRHGPVLHQVNQVLGAHLRLPGLITTKATGLLRRRACHPGGLSLAEARMAGAGRAWLPAQLGNTLMPIELEAFPCAAQIGDENLLGDHNHCRRYAAQPITQCFCAGFRLCSSKPLSSDGRFVTQSSLHAQRQQARQRRSRRTLNRVPGTGRPTKLGADLRSKSSPKTCGKSVRRCGFQSCRSWFKQRCHRSGLRQRCGSPVRQLLDKGHATGDLQRAEVEGVYCGWSTLRSAARPGRPVWVDLDNAARRS